MPTCRIRENSTASALAAWLGRTYGEARGCEAQDSFHFTLPPPLEMNPARCEGRRFARNFHKGKMLRTPLRDGHLGFVARRAWMLVCERQTLLPPSPSKLRLVTAGLSRRTVKTPFSDGADAAELALIGSSWQRLASAGNERLHLALNGIVMLKNSLKTGRQGGVSIVGDSNWCAMLTVLRQLVSY